MKEIKLRDTDRLKGYVALVDDEDFDYLNQWSWRAANVPGRYAVYALRSEYKNGKTEMVAMHRVILGAQKGQMVDHIDRNALNNQRANLRFANHSQNGANKRQKNGSTCYAGVSYLDPNKPSTARYAKKPYKAHIKFRRKQLSIGCFATLEEAVEARDRAALYYFGEFAFLNHPERLEEYRANPYTPRASHPAA